MLRFSFPRPWGNGKENGNFYSIFGSIGIPERKMETIIVD